METTVLKTPPATKASQKPLKVFRLEDVSASVFANVRTIGGDEVTFYNVSFSRTYKQGDQYKRTQTFDFGDLGKVLTVIKQASDYLLSLQSSESAPPVR